MSTGYRMQQIEHRISKMSKNIPTQRLVSTTNATVAIAKRRKACSTLAGAEPRVRSRRSRPCLYCLVTKKFPITNESIPEQ
jgi:hypothetical protein